MDSTVEMRAFARVIERASFSAAAADLGLTPSAISKLVSRLENRLGVRLLHRTTRRLALTPEGEIYHRHARNILAAIDEAEAEVSQGQQAPHGRLRVNCVTAFALPQLVPALPDFQARYPGVDIELTITDRIVDLIAENADIAIRAGMVDNPSVVVRKIAHLERRVFAAPAYLERRGAPRSPYDLVNHDCILVTSMDGGRRWPFRQNGEITHIEIPARILVDNGETALQLAVEGAGIVRLGDVLATAAVREKKLVPLFAESHVTEARPLSAVFLPGRHRMPKVKAFIDFLVQRFAHAPWRDASAHP